MDRLTLGELVRSAGEVDPLCTGVEAEAPEEGGSKVGGGGGISLGLRSQLVAGPEDGPALDTAAGKHKAIAVGPVIAAGGAIEPRTTAELNRGDDER